MTEFLIALKDAIEAAAASPAALAACIILVLAGLAYSWFPHARERTKLPVFLLLVALAGFLFTKSYLPPLPGPDPIVRSSYIVDLQYEGISGADATRVMSKLRDKGWTIYGAERVGPFEPTLVKFGAESNARAAAVLTEDVRSLGSGLAPVRQSRDARIRPTHLELWVGSEVAAATPIN